MIVYIKLLEGTETLVPVEGSKLTGDLFKITENRYLDLNGDATSVWEFFPGDTVRCEFVDSNLVAKELVHSDFPNRRLHQLIFSIVKRNGVLTDGEVIEFGAEISQLCKGTSLKQEDHPIVRTWIINNCDLKNL